MVGHNANEGAYFTPPYIKTTAEVEAQVYAIEPYIPRPVLLYITNVLYPAVFDGTYPYRTQYQRTQLLVSELVFTCNTYYLDKAFQNKTYSYLFSVPPAYHGFDVPYTYWTRGAVNAQDPTEVTNKTVALALQVSLHILSSKVPSKR